ncbi:hypothetical protein [Symbioplanes lichenis]|uniref:hypothetical protein n=1 Tax=Symbioplanes lichenis TaxID=1629072 RepID=UPI002738BA85|nr:hypothetical protein [Actinoplanes lichenis]
MTDEPLPEESGNPPTDNDEHREQKGSPEQPWSPGEQPYSDRPEQGGETPGPVTVEPPD